MGRGIADNGEAFAKDLVFCVGVPIAPLSFAV